MINFFIVCFLTHVLSTFSAPNIEIETIIVDRDTNIFINDTIDKGIEFTTNIVPIKYEKQDGDNRTKDCYEYCVPQETFYIKEDSTKVILVHDFGGISYLIYKSSGKKFDSLLLSNPLFIQRINNLMKNKVGDGVNDDKKNPKDFFMTQTGVNFLIKYNKNSKLGFRCNPDTHIKSPHSTTGNSRTLNVLYQGSKKIWKAKQAPPDCTHIFIKHRADKIEIDYAKNQNCTTAFQMGVCDIALPQKRPKVSSITTIIGVITIIGFVGIGSYYLLKHVTQKKLKGNK